MNRLPTFLPPIIVLFLLAFTSSVQAIVIVDKPLALTTPVQGLGSSSGAQQLAEDFALNQPAMVTDVAFYGWFLNDQISGAFDILFFTDLGGLPSTTEFFTYKTGSLVGSYIGEDIADINSRSIYRWATSIPTALFPSAGDYWISIRDTESATEWIWEHSNPGGDGLTVSRPTNTSAWSAFVINAAVGTDTQAFQLVGNLTVPEPASLSLIILGLAILHSVRRKKTPSTFGNK